MQRATHGATLGGSPQQFLLGLGVIAGREVKDKVDLSYSSRVCGHGLFHFVGGAINVEVMG